MVYLDADNNLEGAGIKDFNEMETNGSTNSMNVIVEMDRVDGYDSSNGNWTGAKIFYVKKDSDMRTINSEMLKDLGEVNMGDPSSLTDFVKYSKENYPADHYALIIWNHGGGWKKRKKTRHPLIKGVAYDDTDNDHLTMAEVKAAMETIKNTLGQKLDVLDYDACLMGMIEVAYQIKDSVSYFSASEETEPGDGNPYDTILPEISSGTSAADFAKTIAEKYTKSYESGWSSVTKAAIDLSKISTVVEAINSSVASMQGKMASMQNAISSARNSVLEFYDSDYVDLKDLGSKINGFSSITSAVSSAVIYNGHTGSMTKSTGLSIYFPKTSSRYLSRYDGLSFAQDSSWNEFLKRYYDPSSDTTVSDDDNGSGSDDTTTVSDDDNGSGSDDTTTVSDDDNGSGNNDDTTTVSDDPPGLAHLIAQLLDLIFGKDKVMRNGSIDELKLNVMINREQEIENMINSKIFDAINNKDISAIQEFNQILNTLNAQQKAAIMPFLNDLRMQIKFRRLQNVQK